MTPMEMKGAVEMLEECFSIEETARTYKVDPEVVRGLAKNFETIISGDFPIEEVSWLAVTLH